MHWFTRLHHFFFGSIVAVRISAFEERDLHRFVEDCLIRYRLERTDRNRALLREILHAYPGGRTPSCRALIGFLDEVFRSRRCQ
jgi:hypothetical protein